PLPIPINHISSHDLLNQDSSHNRDLHLNISVYFSNKLLDSVSEWSDKGNVDIEG
ncbi:6293_t:CDS:1, partial [Racocetra fulgida]